MKITHRILSLFLTLAIVISLAIVPINISYADGGSGDGAGNTSSTGGSKGGTWSSDRTGIRVYVVNEKGELMSNIVDILSDPKIPQYTTAACFGTRDISHIQWYKAGSIKLNTIYQSTANLDNGKTTPVVVLQDTSVGLKDKGLPIQDYAGGTFTTSGETLRKTMLGTPDSGEWGGVSGGGGGSGSVEASKPDVGSTISGIIDALQSEVDLYRATGIYTNDEIVIIIGRKIESELNKLMTYTNSVGEPLYTKEQLSTISAALLQFKQGLMVASQSEGTANAKLSNSDLIQVAYADETKSEDGLAKLYKNGYLIKLMEANIGSAPLFKFNTSSGITELSVLQSTGQTSFLKTCADHNFIIFMEPLFYNRLNKANGDTSSYLFYGTVSNYGQFINDEEARGGWSNGDNKGGNLDRALHKSLVWSMYTEFNLNTAGMSILAGTSHPNFKGIVYNNVIQNSEWWGFGLHYYKFTSSESGTHTWDSHNYPTDGSGTYVEHPAPDPSKDPCTSTTVEKNKDKLHYRIVKVYDQEVLYASIDENGELTLTKGTEHVSTHVREQTLPKIEVQDEMPEYRMVEWKYTYDQYVPVTEGGTESTKWEDEPIAGRTVVNSDIAA